MDTVASRSYGILWRWHFLAGLAACPVIAILAVTGALYVVQPELEHALYRELREVTPRGQPKSIDELVQRLPAECAGESLEVPTRPTDAIRQWCPGDGKHSVFADPYTGALLGEERWDDTVFGFILKIHWELLLGETGRLVVEWATSIAIVLMLSGAYLWWPTRRGGGRWWPRRGVANRQRLRDLHSIAGAYLLPVLFIIAATGLFWTRLAGDDRWHHVADDAADKVWDAPPRSTAPAGRTRIGYDRALAAAGIDVRNEWRGISMWIGKQPDAAYTIYASSRDNDAPWATEIVFVDAYDGSLLRRVGWSGRSALNQINNAGYALHVGAIAGWPGRILVLISSLVLAFLCITGPWMWWKRRPRGALGIPPRSERFAWPLVAGLAVLGWLLPALGYTLLGIAAFELGRVGVRWFVLRRWSR
jgi:uncharacterized iron-regulated membrane protein